MKYAMRLAALTILVSVLLSSAGFAKSRRSTSSLPGGGEGSELHKILSLEDHRFAKDKNLTRAFGSSRRVARAAILAVGRIRDNSAVEDLSRLLNKKDNELKRLAAFSLGLIGSDFALKILLQHLQMQKENSVIAEILVAAGRAGNEATQSAFGNFIGESNVVDVQRAAAEGLGMLWSGPSEKWVPPAGLLLTLTKLAAGPEPVARMAAFALSRYKGDPAQLPTKELIEAAQKALQSPTRAFLYRAVGKLKAPEAETFLVQQFGSSASTNPERIEAAKALSAQTLTDAAFNAYKKGMNESAPHLVYQTLESIFNQSVGAQKLSEAVETVYKSNPSTWIKGAALKTLVSINPALGRQRVNEVLNVPTSPLADAAIGALALSGFTEDAERLVGYVTSEEIRSAEAAVEGLSQIPEDKIPATAKPALRKALERGDTALSSLVAQIVERNRWKELAPTLAATYRLFTSPDQIEAKIAVLNALGAVGDHSHLDVLEIAMGDPEKLVVTAAANAIRLVSGRDETKRIPANSRITSTTPPLSELKAATESTVVLKTSRGDITMKMFEDAPLTAANFVKLVKQGFYSGKIFHRIVPGFVVQGGDPRGDGYGGPGYLIRDEPSPIPHERGTVGVATAGPDTGGCQFFINLGPNLHLNGRYTVFAEVVSGIEVVDKLEVGDRIVSAKVK